MGQVRVTVDGRIERIVTMPADQHSRANEIFAIFDLPEGDHVVTLERLNPQDNVQTRVFGIVVYKKKGSK